MMTNKSYFLILSMIAFIGVQSLFFSHVLASVGNNYYDEIEATFTIPNTTSSVEYILPTLNEGESYLVKTLGVIQVNGVNLNSTEKNENSFQTNELNIVWDFDVENRAISVYKFKAGNAIMAMGGGGEGLCDNGYINSEIPLTSACPDDWVKVTWHRNVSCSGSGLPCGSNKVLWITGGISEISTNACGNLPNINDPNTYFSNLPPNVTSSSSSYTITCGTTNKNGSQCKEIWVKVAMTNIVSIKGKAVSCGLWGLCGTMEAILSVNTGFSLLLNSSPPLPVTDNNISITGNTILPCASQNFTYTLNGMQGYSHLPLNYVWTLSNPAWSIVSGQGTQNVVINTNGSPGNSTLKARIDTYSPTDCRTSFYEEEITIGRNYGSIPTISTITLVPDIYNYNDFCENTSTRFYVSSNPQGDPGFVGYTWKVSSPNGAARIKSILGGSKATYISGTNPADPFIDLYFEMEESATLEVRYEYTCQVGPWFTIPSPYYSEKLPLAPTNINLTSNNSLCSWNDHTFKTTPVSNYNYVWTANSGLPINTSGTANEILSFGINSITNTITSLDLSVSAVSRCGSSPSFQKSYPFNQPASEPQVDIPECFDRGNSTSKPNRLEVTNPEVGVEYIWNVVPSLNGIPFIFPQQVSSNTTIFDFGLGGGFMDELYIRVTADGCIGGDPQFEVDIPDPVVAAEGSLCVTDEESKKGSFVNEEYNGIKIYPNPSKDKFSITTTFSGTKNVTIYNLNGSILDEFQFKGEMFEYNSSNLKSGIYIVKIKTEDNEYPIKLNVL